MSIYSSTTNELFSLVIDTQYGDEGDGRVWRSRRLRWRAFGWDGDVDIEPPHRQLKHELKYFRYRFSAQHFPYEESDYENLAARYEEQRK